MSGSSGAHKGAKAIGVAEVVHGRPAQRATDVEDEMLTGGRHGTSITSNTRLTICSLVTSSASAS